MHGQGVYTWADGRTYDGMYCKEKKHGLGKFMWTDGRSYLGYWQNGKQHGDGVLRDSRGEARGGHWIEGKRDRWLEEIPLIEFDRPVTAITLRYTAPLGSERLATVSCFKANGDECSALLVDVECTWKNFNKMLQQALVAHGLYFAFVLPDGNVLGEVPDDEPIANLFTPDLF